MNADLHSHSVFSDGTLTPEALASRAHRNGVTLWSLTDHDTLDGQVSAQNAAVALGLSYLTGVEISASFLGKSIHIVGLGVDIQNLPLQQGLEHIRRGRWQRGQAMASALDAAGIPDAWQGAMRFASHPETVSRAHFARYLVQQGICPTIHAVFQKYLVPGRPGYVPHQWASLQDAVGWIGGAGGLAVIAHPARYRLTDMQEYALLCAFKECGGTAIEVVTGSQQPSEYSHYAAQATYFGLKASRGSDFHCPKESRMDIGSLPALPPECVAVWE